MYLMAKVRLSNKTLHWTYHDFCVTFLDIHIGVTVRHAIKLYSVIRDKWLLFCCRSSSEKQRWLEAFLEERKLVNKDKSEGVEFPPAAKQLARVAARCQRRPPRKPGGTIIFIRYTFSNL